MYTDNSSQVDNQILFGIQHFLFLHLKTRAAIMMSEKIMYNIIKQGTRDRDKDMMLIWSPVKFGCSRVIRCIKCDYHGYAFRHWNTLLSCHSACVTVTGVKPLRMCHFIS